MNIQNLLDTLQPFRNPKADLEQYTTPTSIVLDWITRAQADLQSAHVLDLGAGTGVLGIAASLVGASKLTFLEVDEEAIRVLEENTKQVRVPFTILHSPVKSVPCDVVLTNPPFGTKNRHADKQFVQAACMSAPVVYSMHLAGSEEFISEVASETGHVLTDVWTYSFPLARSMSMHTQVEKRIEVVVVRLAIPL
ncbi:MAG: METTL5 family protein [Candidatus Woesearchaeota archaeon]